MTDEMTMNSYKNGSETAFLTLYEKYSPLVYGYARKRLSHAEVEDFYQNVWRHLHEKRELYIGQPFAAWFFVLIRNLLYDEYRSRSRHKKLLERIEPKGKEEKLDLVGLLSEVPEETAVLIRKYYIEGYDYSDLENETGLSQTGLRKRLSRAIQDLRSKFEGKI